MHYEIKCPRCRWPMSSQVAVDHGHDALVDFNTLEYIKGQDSLLLNVLICQRCGYKKQQLLLGVPDDERDYTQWAQDEANLVVMHPEVFAKPSC